MESKDAGFKALRLSLGLSQNDAAGRLGVSVRTVQYWDKEGAPPPAMAKLDKVRDSLPAVPEPPKPGRPKTDPLALRNTEFYYWADAGQRIGDRTVEAPANVDREAWCFVMADRPPWRLCAASPHVHFAGRFVDVDIRLERARRLPDWLKALSEPHEIAAWQKSIDDRYAELCELGASLQAQAAAEKARAAATRWRGIHSKALVLLDPPHVAEGDAPFLQRLHLPLCDPPGQERPIPPDLWARAEAAYDLDLAVAAEKEEAKRMHRAANIPEEIRATMAALQGQIGKGL